MPPQMSKNTTKKSACACEEEFEEGKMMKGDRRYCSDAYAMIIDIDKRMDVTAPSVGQSVDQSMRVVVGCGLYIMTLSSPKANIASEGDEGGREMVGVAGVGCYTCVYAFVGVRGGTMQRASR